MTLKRTIELLHNSSERMLEALKLNKDASWWVFMRWEVWVHLRRTLQLLYIVYLKKFVHREKDNDDGED